MQKITKAQVYDLLKREGFSPMKALEISIDWERGDGRAKRWVDHLIEIEIERGQP